LSMGDSSALRLVKMYLSRNETYIDTFVYSLFQPQWSSGPIAPSCAFGFETVWSMRPTSETLTIMAPGLVQYLLHSIDADEESRRLLHIIKLVENAGDPQLKYLFMMLFHMETMKELQQSGIHSDRLFKQAGLETDTLYAIVNELIAMGEKSDGFDMRDVMNGLENNGREFIDWAIANGQFEQDRRHWIELMLTCGLTGYDSLMKPIACDSLGKERCEINHLDICYMLRYGTAKNRKELLLRYGNKKVFREVAPYFRLSLMRSNKEIRKLIDSLPLYDPDTLDTRHWHAVEWSANDYLMLVPNKKIDRYKWRYLFIFQSFATNFAAKTWQYYVLVNDFRNKQNKEAIIARVQGYDMPWEFAYDIMKINDLRDYAESFGNKQVESEFTMYWENPLMEQVLAHRMLLSGECKCLLRFMPNYDSDYTPFLECSK
jgi:hypothetical protein